MSVRDLTILGCSSQQPTRFRNHGAYLLRWNDEGLLFDPGEGTQRQFIYANVAPTVVNRIFISHFHGDHCLGLGSILMRLNLDKVTHPIHCYYPASGKKYFDRLRYGTIYHERINVVEHPVSQAGLVEDDGHFRIEAAFLEHGVENIGWRVTEPDTRKFDIDKLNQHKVRGPLVKELQEKGRLIIDGKEVTLDEVSWIRKGDSFAIVIDTLPCQSAIDIAHGANILLCESTYLEEHKDLAMMHHHMTAKQAATIAKQAQAKQLILTHFSARYQNLKLFETEARSIFPNTFIADDLITFPFPKVNVKP
ncbi:ribonuclease Z [Candidatus Protochlamydia phocaeensis]|uniref:ribonuclease Z n=1 Tax=Candidatus Protochlamydia phocaeensis TaxID=1414722 RepID=UPI0008386D8F|nr:ribonuclease Z [Candidatus Protochlamydia phocaeensis]